MGGITAVEKASTPDEARARVGRIRTHVEDIKRLLVEAWEGRDWQALGYGGWDEYCTAEFGAAIAIPKSEREDLVFHLRDHGMSLRAIESATGIPRATAARHLSSGVSNGTPEAPAQAVKVIGVDGKSYNASRPAAQDQTHITVTTLQRPRSGSPTSIRVTSGIDQHPMPPTQDVSDTQRSWTDYATLREARAALLEEEAARLRAKPRSRWIAGRNLSPRQGNLPTERLESLLRDLVVTAEQLIDGGDVHGAWECGGSSPRTGSTRRPRWSEFAQFLMDEANPLLVFETAAKAEVALRVLAAFADEVTVLGDTDEANEFVCHWDTETEGRDARPKDLCPRESDCRLGGLGA